MKQAQNSRVRELVKKIENHPHRHSLLRDFQQNEAYKPFSSMTKQMIQDVGNVELFELFGRTLRRRALNIILEFKGVVYFTCEHLLKETVANRTLNTQWTFFQFLDTSSRREDLYLRVNSRKTSSGPRFEKETQQKRVHRDPWVFSCEITIFRKRMLEHDRDENVLS